MNQACYIVEDLDTGATVRTVTREGAESVFDAFAGRGHEVELRHRDDDGRETFVKRYAGQRGRSRT